MCLMIAGKKMHIKQINIKNHVCNCHFNNSIEAKKIETRHILIDDKNYKKLVIFLLDIFAISR